MTTEQLPPVGGGDGPIWDRPEPPPSGNSGKIALAIGLLVVVALAGLGIGWLLASFGGGGGGDGGSAGPSTTASTSPSASASTGTSPKPTATSQIEAGRTTDFGYFLAAATRGGATHITFDRAQLLVGKAANDYAKAHHMETPVPNDYLLLNVNKRTRDLVLAPEVTVTGTTIMANSTEPVPVSLQTLFDAIKAHGKDMPLDIKYDAHGYVVSVAERFFP
jgi:hypothetical protein